MSAPSALESRVRKSGVSLIRDARARTRLRACPSIRSAQASVRLKRLARPSVSHTHVCEQLLLHLLLFFFSSFIRALLHKPLLKPHPDIRHRSVYYQNSHQKVSLYPVTLFSTVVRTLQVAWATGSAVYFDTLFSAIGVWVCGLR